MANRHKVIAKQSGGKIEAKVIAAAKKGGSNPGIKAIQKNKGGEVEAKVPGKKSGGRLDKFARGGATKSPFSSASAVKK
jgi:hypothetical protein